MDKSFISTQVPEVLSFALLNKYNNWSLEEIKNYILLIINESKNNFFENISQNNSSLRNDVLNQLIIFERIEREWTNSPLNIKLVKKINAQLRGLNLQKLMYRETEFVKDFGGNALTHSSEIPKELEEYKKLLALADNYIDQDKKYHVNLMAKIFCEMIRIHPFEDGNGRTARVLIQILARKWGYKLIIIPKYRNDEKWKSALNKGVNGKYSLVADFFQSRLNKK